MIQVRVSGTQQFAAADRRIKRGVRGAEQAYVASAARGLKAQSTVKAAVPRYLPSGYAPVLAGALQVKAATRGGQVEVTAKAPGRRGHDRKIADMERGKLRHPKWPRGPRKTWKWHAQTIKPRFFSEPLTQRRKHIEAQIKKEMQRVAKKCTKG